MSSTEEKKRHERFLAAIKEVTSSKEKALKFLQETGIADKDGNLAPMYR